MCSSMRAHWRDLANMTELVLHSVHLTPQPRGQIDRFRKSLYTTMIAFPLKLPLPMGIWTPSNTIHWPIQAHKPNGISIGSAVFVQMTAVSLHFTTERPLPSQNCPFPSGDLDPHLTWFRGPTRVLKQKASRSVQPFLQGSLV